MVLVESARQPKPLGSLVSFTPASGLAPFGSLKSSRAPSPRLAAVRPGAAAVSRPTTVPSRQANSLASPRPATSDNDSFTCKSLHAGGSANSSNLRPGANGGAGAPSSLNSGGRPRPDNRQPLDEPNSLLDAKPRRFTSSTRFRLQQQLARDGGGDERQQSLARAEMAKQLQASAQLREESHPLGGAGGRWDGGTHSYGWRHLPLEPNAPYAPPPSAGTKSPRARGQRQQEYRDFVGIEDTSSEDMNGSFRTNSAMQPKWDARTNWWEQQAAQPLSVALLNPAVAAGPTSYIDEDGHEHEMAPEVHSNISLEKAREVARDKAYRRLAVEQDLRQYTGPVRNFDIDGLYSLSSDQKPRPNAALDAIFGRPPVKPLPPLVQDAITPATFGTPKSVRPATRGGAMTERQRLERLTSPKRASRSARGRRGQKRSDSPEPLILPDEECLQLFSATARLPPFKRVKERMKLLREQPFLRYWLDKRAGEHRAVIQEALISVGGTDFVARNSDSANFTPEALEEKQRRNQRRINVREKRTAHAQMVAANPDRGDEFAISSDVLTKVRQYRRFKDLKKGLVALEKARQAARAQRWAALIRTAHAATTMRGILKLAKLVRKIRTGSRVERAVRTVQRRFRDRKTRREQEPLVKHVVVIQGLMRQYVNKLKRKRMGAAVGVVCGFLRASQRLSPIEMAIKRYVMRVKLVQRYMRGFASLTRGKLVLLNLQWKRLEMRRLVEDYGHVSTSVIGGGSGASVSAAGFAGVASGAAAVEDKRKGFEKGACSGAKFSAGVMKDKGIVSKGQYTGVPEDMLDLPLPHVPEEMRVRTLKKLLGAMRKRHVEEMIKWDQQVLLKAESHPALIGGDRGVQRLAVIQHELTRDKATGKNTTEKYAAVLAIMDNMAVPTEKVSSKADNPFRGQRDADGNAVEVSSRVSLTRKLQRLNSSLSEQRAALDEIRASIPRPFQRKLVSWDKLKRAFETVHAECAAHHLFENRPIRPAPRRASAPAPAPAYRMLPTSVAAAPAAASRPGSRRTTSRDDVGGRRPSGSAAPAAAPAEAPAAADPAMAPRAAAVKPGLQ